MNIIDYCEWRGDISFKKDPFNLIDGLCLSQLSYAPFDGLIQDDKKMKLSDLADVFFNDEQSKQMLNSKTFTSNTPNVLRAMADTIRFKDCKIYNYVSIFHSDTTEQFAAFMIDLPDHTTAICFRGTDDTLIGWHEDLLLSYTLMPSQVDATNYLNKYCRPFHRYRIMGHSKGGNLALYAALNCSSFVSSHIIQVISYDGPGLRHGTYSNERFEKMSKKYFKVVPEYDFFGTIYDRCDNKTVVKSDQRDVLQHGGMSWQIIGNHFDTVEDVYPISKSFKNGFDKFTEETTTQEKSEMVKELFNYLEQEGIQNFSDFANGGMPVVIKGLKAVRELKPEAKETLSKLIKMFADAHADSLEKSVKDSRKQVLHKAQELENDIESFVDTKVSKVKRKIKKKK